MKRKFLAVIIMSSAISVLAPIDIYAENEKDEADKMIQAGMTFTVPQGKQLIAKAVAQMPIVKAALKNGIVIVCKGTTNTYIAEELLGRSIQPGTLVSGKITPANSSNPFKNVEPMSEVVILKGEYKPQMTLTDALQQLQPGDVVIKGANALDYENKTAGVLIGAPDGGTTGKILPYIVASKAHLVIPIGLEKQIAADVVQVQLKMRQPMETLKGVPSMFLLTGHIVTEIEALNILADVEAFQAAAGGIEGAEGSAWLVARGSRSNVEKALSIAEDIYSKTVKSK
ncbi:MAG: hypothetical protein LLF76_05535 [Planctomycetaceae bacterium]|nr:hypothetical protein [Planctomycetaceae bacterium]